MSIYQRDKNPAPDSNFEPGELHHLIVGKRGRLLDSRRTPVRIVRVEAATGYFHARIEGFEDEGAIWQEVFENVCRYQFERGTPNAEESDVTQFALAVLRLDQPMRIESTELARSRTKERIDKELVLALAWLNKHSRFLRAGYPFPDPKTRLGSSELFADLQAFMQERKLWDIEQAFARQFVSNPYSGELVKGHRIVIAEMGLSVFADKVVRTPDLFDGEWSRERRASHVIARLAFVRGLFTAAERPTLTLYRGLSTDGTMLHSDSRTFISTTFNLEVARSHFDAHVGPGTRALYAQTVPIERVFMTYLETESMNQQYKEAEAVLFYDTKNLAF